MSISSNFLLESNPKKNLEILAGFRPSDTSGTKCTTQKAYSQVPKTHLTPSTLREISLVAAGFVVFSAPFLFSVRKAIECAGLLVGKSLNEAQECKNKLIQAIADPVHTMAYLCLISGVAIAATAAYAGARCYFQDKNQETRFQALNIEYSAAAGFLVKEYGSAKKQEQQVLVETAQKLIRNGELIRYSLSNVVRLSDPQASLLFAKITHAAKEVLRLDASSQLKQAQPQSFSLETAIARG